jgi:tetratricopeptide (TPR) repeat protein
MRVIRPHCLLAAALLVSLSVIKVPPALAQAPAIPNWKTLELAVGKENYAEAKRLANAIFRQGTPPDRQKAATVYGRILLAFGQKDEARQYLAVLTKPGNDTSGGQLTAVYAAWFKALDGKPDEAIRTLEKMLDESAPGIATAEAADVLAMLYLARGEKEKAQKAVRFGLKCVEYQTLKDSSVKGCSTETLLRGRLTSSLGQGDAKRLYDNAEKLRAQGKFVEAASRFIQLLAMYPKSPWAHASGFRIGQCYADGGNLAQAADHWESQRGRS